jgi:hypothetical protein
MKDMTEKLFLASVLALSIAGPVQAQNPTQGDYYPFRPTPVPQVSPQREQLISRAITTSLALRHQACAASMPSKRALTGLSLIPTVTCNAC